MRDKRRKENFSLGGHIVDYHLNEEIYHGIYVSKLARGLAEILGFEKETTYSLTLAGILHDIGKLQLNKYQYKENGPLLVEEIRYVRMHTQLGYEILKKRGDYSDFILESIYHHHENYDGSGYPDNLKGEEIPIGARILRICDVFAALTSKRPYRSAFEQVQALELMIDEVKNFDLEIFLAFQKLIHSQGYEEFLPGGKEYEEWLDLLEKGIEKEGGSKVLSLTK
ncbi:MAG TPA: HD domain-containing phosphohydrolase [Lachnospiraceae bacterium]